MEARIAGAGGEIILPIILKESRNRPYKAAGRLEGGWEMHCERCGKATVIEIRMQVAEQDITFRRCGNCEAQGWEDADGGLPLDRVLDLARAR